MDRNGDGVISWNEYRRNGGVN
ncbi:MAG: hypothetical protein R3C46_16240 [Hyphomonadaceae bacterium]